MKKTVVIIVIILFAALAVYFVSGRKKTKERVVVVYVSEDQVFSEPILKEFEQKTGIKVKAIYDTEESKSTGVMNRLIAEKNNPQADVYWANEPIRAEVLKQKGVSAPYFPPNARDIPDMFKDSAGYWTGFSARARVFIINKKVKDTPQSILDYINPKWKGRGVIANPLFGTTTTEIAALFTIWGDEKAKKFMDDLKQNSIAISTSNGESADLVASGEFDFSLVDSDDGINRIKQGKNVYIVYPDQKPGQIGCLIVPNAAVLIKGAPHPKEAKELINFLVSRETEQQLANADCAQIPLHPGLKPPQGIKSLDQIKIMKVNYGDVARKLIEIQPYLKNWVGY